MHFQIYLDEDGEWRWRLFAANGKILGDSGEGYKNKADVIAEVETIKKKASRSPVKFL